LAPPEMIAVLVHGVVEIDEREWGRAFG